MFEKLIKTEKDYGILIIRVFLGAVMLPHGAQKLLGLFGGAGFTNTIGFFTSMGMPWILAFLVIMAESIGALILLDGFLSRFAVFGITCVMIGALLIHLPNGFFMNWFGNQAGEGYEYHLLVIGMGITIMLRGGGALSLDQFLYNKMMKK